MGCSIKPLQPSVMIKMQDGCLSCQTWRRTRFKVMRASTCDSSLSLTYIKRMDDNQWVEMPLIDQQWHDSQPLQGVIKLIRIETFDHLGENFRAASRDTRQIFMLLRIFEFLSLYLTSLCHPFILSDLIWSHLILSDLIWSYLISSYLIWSHLILSDLILSLFSPWSSLLSYPHRFPVRSLLQLM